MVTVGSPALLFFAFFAGFASSRQSLKGSGKP
jgi:hypothetical protein